MLQNSYHMFTIPPIFSALRVCVCLCLSACTLHDNFFVAFLSEYCNIEYQSNEENNSAVVKVTWSNPL